MADEGKADPVRPAPHHRQAAYVVGAHQRGIVTACIRDNGVHALEHDIANERGNVAIVWSDLERAASAGNLANQVRTVSDADYGKGA